MKTPYILLGSSLFIFSLSGCTSTAKTDTTLAAQFEASLLCKTEAIDARDEKVKIQLKEQNVEVKDLDEGGVIDLEYHFAKPLEMLNVTVPSINYQGDSGSYFFAIAQGDMDKFAKSIGATPVPTQSKEELSWGDINQYYKYTAAVTTENPYPNTILIGRDDTSKQGEFYFGCLTFDY